MEDKINSFKELRVYQMAMEAAMEIFQITKSFPPEEKFSMVDQMRRSSRSVWTNIAEECETQAWLEFASTSNYMDAVVQDKSDKIYNYIIAQIIRIVEDVEKWLVR